MSDPRDPRSPEEWREAMREAEFMILLDSARQYGLVAGGPIANVARCLEIIRKGLAMPGLSVPCRYRLREIVKREGAERADCKTPD